MDSILSMEMLLSTLRMAIPLVLASVGGTLCERSGIINLGIEGMMLSGAFGMELISVGIHGLGSYLLFW